MVGDRGLPGLDAQHLYDGSKLLFGPVEDQYLSVANVVDPTMDTDGPGGHAGGDGRMGPQMLELQQDVFFNQRPGHVIARGIGIFGTNHPSAASAFRSQLLTVGIAAREGASGARSAFMAPQSE